MRKLIIGSVMLMCPVCVTQAQVSIEYQGSNIGIVVDQYPDLIRIPGYPVYYAANVDSNEFYYAGNFWTFQNNTWFSSNWYDGPWWAINPYAVPLFILRVPLRYYHRPPMYFHAWRADAPPHWGDLWGPDWARHRHGWDHWNRHGAPQAAALPDYQRRYSGEYYPRSPVEQQTIQHQFIHNRSRGAATMPINAQRNNEPPVQPQYENMPNSTYQQQPPYQQQHNPQQQQFNQQHHKPTQQQFNQQQHNPPQQQFNQQQHNPPQQQFNQQQHNPPQQQFNQQQHNPPQQQFNQQQHNPPQQLLNQQQHNPPQSQQQQKKPPLKKPSSS